MGSFSPTDAPVGSIVRVPKKGNRAEILLDGLQRPVHSDWVDLNGDGRQDGVVCEFAKWTGKLAWWEQDTLGNFQPHILRNRPGAIKTYVRDFNGDHFPDIIALFGQGDEGIYQYINDGKGNFTEKCVLRFPPSWGSSAFRMVDINQDGLEDIVYTCGDNADYQPILKPYHGIRVYTNAGLGIYRETFFTLCTVRTMRFLLILIRMATWILRPYPFFRILKIDPRRRFYIWKTKAQGGWRLLVFLQ
jgi:hypothetical protein